MVARQKILIVDDDEHISELISLYLTKEFYDTKIVYDGEEALRQFIINELHSGATIYEAIGAYNLQRHNEIITIVDKSEYQRLMTFINREDPKAFITVYNVSNMQYQPKIWKK